MAYLRLRYPECEGDTRLGGMEGAIGAGRSPEIAIRHDRRLPPRAHRGRGPARGPGLQSSGLHPPGVHAWPFPRARVSLRHRGGRGNEQDAAPRPEGLPSTGRASHLAAPHGHGLQKAVNDKRRPDDRSVCVSGSQPSHGAACRGPGLGRDTAGRDRDWPPALKVSVAMTLNSGFAQCLCWGPDHIAIYNDAFVPILGNKGDCLGLPFSVIWHEAWPSIGPIAAKAMAGESTFIKDFPPVGPARRSRDGEGLLHLFLQSRRGRGGRDPRLHRHGGGDDRPRPVRAPRRHQQPRARSPDEEFLRPRLCRRAAERALGRPRWRT